MSLALIAVLVFFVLACLFGSVVLTAGAPYLPTLRPQIKAGLDLLDLKPGQTMLEIGCGDGRVLLAAADRGWQAVGYEINPLLVLVCRWRTRHQRKLITVVWGNVWKKNWPPAEGLYIFGLAKIMPKLHTKIVQSVVHPLRVVSFSFPIPNQPIVEERQGVYLYCYDKAA